MQKSISLQYLIKALVLFGFSGYIMYLVRTDGMSYYIAPHMQNYIEWSAIAFFAMAVYQLYVSIHSLWSKTEACDCGHEHHHAESRFKHVFVYGLFILPLLLGFLMPNATMGTTLAAKKGMNLSSSSAIKQNIVAAQDATVTQDVATVPQDVATVPQDTTAVATTQASNESGQETSASDATLETMFVSDIFTEVYAIFAKEIYPSEIIEVKEELFIETLTTIDLFLDQFIGKRISLEGFVYRQDDMTDKQFVLGRFAIQCCAADGSPFGVLVEDDQAQRFATDSWIRATGIIEKTTFNDVEIIQLRLESYEPIPEPGAAYVYINYDFGM